MRIAITLLLAAAGAPLAAQERQPTVTEEQFVCQLAGECAEPGAKPGLPRPEGRVSESRGFVIARPAGTRAAPAKSPAPAARSGARTTGNPRRFAAPTRRSPTPGTGVGAAPSAAYAAAAPVPEGRRKANLFVTFRLGSDELTPEGTAQARVFARALQLPALADKRFAIVGHTDTVGSAQSNIDLSQRRAASVQRFLVANGVSPSRLDVVGRGPNDLLPDRPGTDPANRRVEAEVLN